MANEYVIELNAQNFNEKVLNSKGLVLVDFWAEWCGPCRQAAPLMDDLAKTHAGKLTVAKVNVDHNQPLAVQYHVESIPAFLVFRDGKLADQIIGNRLSKKEWEQKLGLAA